MKLKRRSTQSKGRTWLRRYGLRLSRSRLLLAGIVGLCLIIGGWWLHNTATLRSASQQPVGAFLVLGGSITREIYVAELAKQYPQTPILISKGSLDPCILLIFQRANAPMQNVWLEKCADSTFGNFYFSLPILQQWQVHNVKLITSPTHLPRAKWLAQIVLGSHGIWVEPELVKETGIPGNRESRLSTTLDVTRGFFWAVVSQFYSPKCTDITPLSTVNLQAWKLKGFKCERQANLAY